jgi:hypothetical protein
VLGATDPDLFMAIGIAASLEFAAGTDSSYGLQCNNNGVAVSRITKGFSPSTQASF